MFAQSLLEVSASQRLRKGWLTAGSITLQAVVVLCLLLLPLVKPEGLAPIAHVPVPISWFGSPQPVQAAQPPISAHAGSNTITITVPHNFSFRPSARYNGPDEPAACVICPGAGTGPVGSGISPFGEAQPQWPAPLPAQPHIAPRPPRISHWMEGNLISQVTPQYPPIARTAGIEGQVVLQAIVSREGTIENLKVLSGHPLLVRSAIEAVSQWRYRPYRLNGEPIEVETQVTVNFSLHR